MNSVAENISIQKSWMIQVCSYLKKLRKILKSSQIVARFFFIFGKFDEKKFTEKM